MALYLLRMGSGLCIGSIILRAVENDMTPEESYAGDPIGSSSSFVEQPSSSYKLLEED